MASFVDESVASSSREGYCASCCETFLDLSCYKDGDNVFCPLCMNKLEFNENLQKETSEVDIKGTELETPPMPTSVEKNDVDLKTCVIRPPEKQIEYNGQTTKTTRSIHEKHNDRSKTMIVGSGEGPISKQFGSKKGKCEAMKGLSLVKGEVNISTKLVKSPDKRNVFHRQQTEFIQTKTNTPVGKQMERSKTMFVGSNVAHAKKGSGKNKGNFTSGPQFLNISSELPLTIEIEFMCKRHKGCVNSILPVGSEIAWVVIKNSFLVLYDKQGNLLHSANRLKKTFTDAAADTSANIYLACFNDGCIMKISRVGIMSVFAVTSQMHPTELAVSKQNEIIVAVVGTKNATFVPKKNYGILIYDLDGKIIKSVFELILPFMYPVYVDVSTAGEIVVGDYLRKEVVVMDTTCQNEILRFNGTGVFARSFIPKGVCFDRDGNIIIANWDGAMCLLKRNEEYSPTGLIMSDGFDPLSLAVDDNNRIWVGSRFNGKIRIYNF